MRWETCRLESLSHWVHRQIDPQDSHSDWYRKWGKTTPQRTNIPAGPGFGEQTNLPPPSGEPICQFLKLGSQFFNGRWLP